MVAQNNLFSPLFGRFGSSGLSAPQPNATAATTPSWQSGKGFWSSRLPGLSPNTTSFGMYSVPNNFDASAPGGSPAVGLPTLEAQTPATPPPITSTAQLPPTSQLMNQSMPGTYETEPMPMIPPDPNATSLPPAMPSILDPMGTGGAGLTFGTGMGGEPIDQHAIANAMAQQQYMTPPNAGDGVFASPNAQPPMANAGGQTYANDVGFDLGAGLWDPSEDVAPPPPTQRPAPPTSGPGSPNAFNYQTGNYSNWKDMNIGKRAKKFGDWRPLSPKELRNLNTTGQLPSGYAYRKGKIGISNSKYMAQNNLMGGPGRIGTMYSGMYGNTGPAHVPSAGWQYMNGK